MKFKKKKKSQMQSKKENVENVKKRGKKTDKNKADIS